MDSLIKSLGGLGGEIHTETVYNSSTDTSLTATFNVPAGAKVLSVVGYTMSTESYRTFRVTDADSNEYVFPKNSTYTDGGFTYSNGFYVWSPMFDSTWKNREITQFYARSRNDSSTSLRVGISITYLL